MAACFANINFVCWICAYVEVFSSLCSFFNLIFMTFCQYCDSENIMSFVCFTKLQWCNVWFPCLFELIFVKDFWAFFCLCGTLIEIAGSRFLYSRFSWIGHVNRMDSQRKVNQVFNSNPEGRWLRMTEKTDDGSVYKQILINTKLKTGKRSQKTELTGRSPLRWWRSALDCSAN